MMPINQPLPRRVWAGWRWAIALLALLSWLPPALASAQPSGGELTIGAPGDNYRTDPNRSSIGMVPVNANVFEPLVRMNENYQLEPMLATSWEFKAPNTWRFSLRSGVKFHDGSPFTAEAVKWTMLRAAKSASNNLGMAEDSVNVIDDLSVELTPSRPNLRLIQQLAHPSWSIVAPNTEPVDKAIGTGPFRLAEYRKSDQLVVQRHTEYWGQPAKLDRLTFRFIPDPNTRVLSLQAGQVDIIYDVPRESADDVRKFPGKSVTTSPVGAYQALMINMKGKAGYQLGGDLAVRQAIAYAIDKSSVVQHVWLGNAEVSQTMIPSAILGSYANQVTGIAYDPNRARQSLDGAGWAVGSDGIRAKNGERLSLEMIVGYPTPEIHKPLPEFLQAQLREVGIDIRIVTTADTASYEARLITGDGDLWLEAGNQNEASPCFLLDGLYYTKSSWGGYPQMFAPGGAVDTAIENCRVAVQHDEVQRNAAEAVRLLVESDVVVVPLAGAYRIWGMSDKVGGLVAHPSGVNQRWEQVFLAR